VQLLVDAGMDGHQEKVQFIWSVAELLRGPYRPWEYGSVILPFTVLRRLDCALAATKDAVLAKAATISDDLDPVVRDRVLASAAGGRVYNLSRFTFPRLIADPDGLVRNLNDLVNGYPQDLRGVFIEHFKLPDEVERLRSVDRLYQVVQRFGEIDLHPDRVPNIAMGYIFEELIRRFSEARDEKAGDHFTPREVIRLMVDLLLYEDHEVLTQRGIVRTVFDPACGTGGMLTVAEDYVRELNPQATLVPHGQDWNSESYAVCKSDMLMSGQDPANIVKGDSFTQDGFAGRTFDYMLSNPPFGVDWKAIEKPIRDEHDTRGLAGRFGAGLPRVSDGSLLFVQHMISKMRRDAGASRIAVVLNGSPLFTGGAGSGESEIRRWIIENDWLEAIVGLPTELFYNTGIATYVWIITNRKTAERRGKVQLIDATARWQRMRKSLGQKRKLIPDDARAEIVRAFGDLAESDASKVLDNQDFGFRRITVERPLRLNFRIDDERIARVQQQSALQSLAKSRKRGAAAEAEIEAGERLQREVVATLEGARTDDAWTNRETFAKHLKMLFQMDGVALPTPLAKAVLMGLAERDETADVCTDRRGNREPDPEFRDYENVPLKEDIEVYFEREVLPHVPDAWIDHDKMRIGYEIPFTRHFYRYTPPRPLEEIDAELRELGREIQEMLKEIAA
jgi:type I restriction enzyme M protein